MSTVQGWLLFMQYVVACYFAVAEDWPWFAVAALGCFLIYAYGREDRA